MQLILLRKLSPCLGWQTHFGLLQWQIAWKPLFLLLLGSGLFWWFCVSSTVVKHLHNSAGLRLSNTKCCFEVFKWLSDWIIVIEHETQFEGSCSYQSDHSKSKLLCHVIFLDLLRSHALAISHWPFVSDAATSFGGYEC